MNNRDSNKQSNCRLCESYVDQRNVKRGQIMQVYAAAVCASIALATCIGSYLATRVEAEPVEQEPIVKVNPYAATEPQSPRTEAQDVIDVLQAMGNAYASGDIPGYIKHLDDHCSVFDEGQNRMVEGKEAVITALKQKFAQNSQTGSDHIISYTIDRPYVKVTGEMAVVTYSVIEKVAGQHERTLKGFMSDVFKKEDGQWMKVHQRAVWKRVK